MFIGRRQNAGAGMHRHRAPGVAMDGASFRRLAAAVAMDASGSSGMAFLSAFLGNIRTRIIEPLNSVTHQEHISVTFGGGFVEYGSAFAVDYGTTGGNQYGLQGTNNTDIPLVQANIDMGTWKNYLWQVASIITDLDLKRVAQAVANGQPAPVSLERLYRDAVGMIWNKALDKVTYTGWLGTPGLLNNPDIGSSLVPVGASGYRNWARKNPAEIQADINAMILAPLQAGVYADGALPDTTLVPYDVYNTLFQPYVLGGIGGFNSIGQWVQANNIAKERGVNWKIQPLPNPWISGIGAGGTNRAVTYRNADDTVELVVPAVMAPVMTVPSIKDGGSYETAWSGNIGQVRWYRPQIAWYYDGV